MLLRKNIKMQRFRSVPETLLLSFYIHYLITVVNLTAASIESNGDGSYCINKIPRRGVSANCSSDSTCEELLGIPIQEGNYLRCGQQGECITKQFPKNEYCKDACEKSDCSKYCLQEYEAKTAMFCIETRDHPNAMPSPVNNTGGVFSNKFYCTCVLTEQPYHHRIVSRYLSYKIVSE